ncbi:MAG: hypothetical protein BWK80_35750 [Desulfobacteraceae bacterium IS3]|nr:MAG: hypothetical protein BWK80_35750 [Desulfobacteraceae bacterium IS3]
MPDNITDNRITAIACSVFRSELQSLSQQGLITFPIRFLNSHLHMNPEKLHELMARFIQKECSQGFRVLLIYGDCHANMQELEADKCISRVKAVSCGQLLLGKQRYKEMIKSGAFLLFPEWISRWRNILLRFPGLDPETGKEMLRQMHSRFVYLNTGTCAVPYDTLKQCGEFFNLPYEIEEVSLELMLALIRESLAKFDSEGQT